MKSDCPLCGGSGKLQIVADGGEEIVPVLLVAYDDSTELDIDSSGESPRVTNHNELVNQGKTTDVIRGMSREQAEEYNLEVVEPGSPLWDDCLEDLEIGEEIPVDEIRNDDEGDDELIADGGVREDETGDGESRRLNNPHWRRRFVAKGGRILGERLGVEDHFEESDEPLAETIEDLGALEDRVDELEQIVDTLVDEIYEKVVDINRNTDILVEVAEEKLEVTLGDVEVRESNPDSEVDDGPA
ncbi:MAG: hypothetical protein ACOCY7_01365 [Halodesulfurarchaeum sp.]